LDRKDAYFEAYGRAAYNSFKPTPASPRGLIESRTQRGNHGGIHALMNISLDGCCDHSRVIADDEFHERIVDAPSTVA
jgi:hypothetical protein